MCNCHFYVPVVWSGSCVLSDRRLSSLGALQVALASKRIRKIEGVRAARRQLPVTPSIDHNWFCRVLATLSAQDYWFRIAINEARTSSNFEPTNPTVG